MFLQQKLANYGLQIKPGPVIIFVNIVLPKCSHVCVLSLDLSCCNNRAGASDLSAGSIPLLSSLIPYEDYSELAYRYLHNSGVKEQFLRFSTEVKTENQ